MIIKSKNKKNFLFAFLNYVKKNVFPKYTLLISSALILLIIGSLTGGLVLQIYNKGLPYKDFTNKLYYSFINIPRTIKVKVKDKSEIIYFDLNFKNVQKLEEERKKQLASVYHIKNEESYVKAKVKNKNKSLNAEIRLKGDGSAGHFAGKKKWSLRVKIQDGNTLFGIRKFSIQKPETLEFVYEWLFNKAFRAEGGISKRYKFVRVYFNGDYWGIMTFHEHFDKILIENNNRRAAPIIRFDTDYRNQAVVKDFKLGEIFGETNVLPITHYQRQRSDINFKEEYKTASALLEGLRKKQLKASEVLDIEKFAIYVALCDLFEGYHGLIDANMAFYYNPITTLLEPIAEDIDATTHIASLGISMINGYLETPKLWVDLSTSLGNRLILTRLFQDNKFTEKYMYYLSKFSKENYLKSFFKNVEEDLNKELNTIYTDYHDYSFDINNNILVAKQKKIRELLDPPIGLLSYFHKEKGQNIHFKVGAVQYLPVEIVSVNYDGIDFPILNKEKIIFGKKKYKLINYNEIIVKIPNNISFTNKVKENLNIEYKILGTDKIFSNKINSNTILSYKKKLDPFRKENNFKKFDYLIHDEQEKTIFMKEGEWVLNEDLIIPKGYTFVIKPNTKIDLINSSAIISYSPVRIMGSRQSLIIIDSTDSTGQGLSVLTTNEDSEIRYTLFKNLNSLQRKSVKLFGGVNFYESNVEINNSTFENSKSEDALNIIRSKAKIFKTNFINTSFDALDTDFSEVKIQNSNFLKIGNDAIDTSGSLVMMRYIKIIGADDKALSIGERSQLIAKDLSIDKSNIGIAIKDSSIAEIKFLNISNTNVGITVFQKKSEYGPASAKIEIINIEQVKDSFMVESNSNLSVDGKSIKAKYINLREKFY